MGRELTTARTCSSTGLQRTRIDRDHEVRGRPESRGRVERWRDDLLRGSPVVRVVISPGTSPFAARHPACHGRWWRPKRRRRQPRWRWNSVEAGLTVGNQSWCVFQSNIEDSETPVRPRHVERGHEGECNQARETHVSSRDVAEPNRLPHELTAGALSAIGPSPYRQLRTVVGLDSADTASAPKVELAEPNALKDALLGRAHGPAKDLAVERDPRNLFWMKTLAQEV
jgi:hypothetical protein